MKSLKLVSILIISTLLFTIASCDNEPLEGVFNTNPGTNEVTCAAATQNLSTASTNYATTATDDVSYPVVCNAYAVALQNKITACGDDTGEIQTLIDGLDCPTVSNDCTTAQTATDTAETAYNVDNTNVTLCNVYQTALQNEITQCGDSDGSLQDIVDGLDCTSGGTADGHAFMTANLDGEQFDIMKPNGYNFFQTAILMQTFSSSNDEDYILIQGNTTYTIVSGNEFTKEINLHIPQSNWAVGTYPLQTNVVNASSGDINTHYNIIYNNGDGSTQAYEEEGGTITITEFNLTDRVIRGTFEFQYTRYFVDTGVETGPFDCINGTFDYSLDADYFD